MWEKMDGGGERNVRNFILNKEFVILKWLFFYNHHKEFVILKWLFFYNHHGGGCRKKSHLRITNSLFHVHVLELGIQHLGTLIQNPLYLNRCI